MEFRSEDQAAGYLAAMIDGEGCVEFKPMPGGKKSWRRRVRITNTSPSIIAAIEAANDLLGIHYTKHPRNGTNKPGWEINYPGTSIDQLAALLVLGDDNKRERLEAAACYVAPRMTRGIDGRITGSEID